MGGGSSVGDGEDDCGLKWWWGPGDGARDDCTVVG